MPDSEITFSDEAFNDPRNYRVTCEKLATVLPAARPTWTVRSGIGELYEAFGEYGLTVDDLEGYMGRVIFSGGEIVVPKFTIPGVGRACYFTDTTGMIVGLHQPDPSV